MTHARLPLIGAGLALSALFLSSGALAFDEAAAKALAKRNDCTKCHAIDKDKKGPSYKKIAAKHAGKADAEDKLSKAITSATKVKLADGSEEEHKVIDTKDAKEVKNLVQWILSL
ncbi:MAG: c-type cytochrome [Vitreoscilla sp.]|nr:c-type cytochrome [Burkholderiales bacterium]MBP6338012.1 c-type cytochrome [Vitreoscilla sp.]MBP6675971.1 c-type cytochrome [Vitreoscilla sp.]